jgi:hypothetical protein
VSIGILYALSHKSHTDFLPNLWAYLKLVLLVSVLGAFTFKAGNLLFNAESSGANFFASDYSFLFNLLILLILWFFASRARKIRFAKLFDMFSVPILIWQSLGKLGCFSAGCCAGNVNFGPLVIPIQIAESCIFALFAFSMLVIRAHSARIGLLSFLFVSAYCVERFLAEFFRTDTAKVIGGLSMYQLISMVLLITASASYRSFEVHQNQRARLV